MLETHLLDLTTHPEMDQLMPSYLTTNLAHTEKTCLEAKLLEACRLQTKVSIFATWGTRWKNRTRVYYLRQVETSYKAIFRSIDRTTQTVSKKVALTIWSL